MSGYQVHNLINFSVHPIPTQVDASQNARISLLESKTVATPLNAAQIAALVPVTGQIVFNSSVNQFWGWNGAAWTAF